jgi:predicted esterase
LKIGRGISIEPRLLLEKSFEQAVRIYYDLHLPERGPRTNGLKYPLLIALHGYGGNKESMMNIAKQINDRDVVIASLQGPYQFNFPFGADGFSHRAGEGLKIGFCWTARWKDDESIALHHQNLIKLIDTVSGEVSVDRSRIFLMGFSQPVALNYRFVFSTPDTVRGVVAVCGGVPGDWETGAYQRSSTDVLHLATDQDQYYPLERSQRFEAMLARRAAEVEFRVYKGRHKFPVRAIPHIAQWLKTRM